jgi:hypothetical protein
VHRDGIGLLWEVNGGRVVEVHRDWEIVFAHDMVVTSLICLSLNGRTAKRLITMTPMGIPSRSSGTPSRVRQTNAVQQTVSSFDHSRGGDEKQRRDGDVESLRGLQVTRTPKRTY